MKLSNRNKRKVKTWAWAYLLIAPTLIGVCILNLWPIVQSVYYSFNQIKGFEAPSFIGMANYSRLFKDAEVFRSIGNTLCYSLLTVPVGIFISLITAVLLNTGIKAKGLFRCIYFLPVVSAPTAVALVWKWLYNKQYGLVNEILGFTGMGGPDWLGNAVIALPSVAIVGIWSMVGYNMIILIAGLQNIPGELYEAAQIDGAGPFSKFIKITLPLVSPTLFFVSVTTTISSIQVFDLVYMMIKESSPSFKAVETIVYLFYRYTFKNYNKGYGSAIVVLLLIIIMFMTWLQMRLQKKWVHYE
jgi:multiple sugar transport system permease protein